VPRNFDRIVEYYMQYYENIITRLFAENGYEIVKPEQNQTQPAEPNPNTPV
jgi:hypothetical protein